MTTTQGFSRKTVEVGDRRFVVTLLKFANGSFLSVSEGVQRIGSMAVSLSTGPTPVTTTVIPAKSESLFLKLTAEQISTAIRGISIVCASIKGELDNESARGLLKEIMEMIKSV